MFNTFAATKEVEYVGQDDPNPVILNVVSTIDTVHVEFYQDNNTINCFSDKKAWNISIYSDVDYQKNQSFYSLNLMTSVKSSKFEFGVGVGYLFNNSDILATWNTTETSYEIVGTIAYDSTYFVNNIMYHNYGKIDIYDSVESTKPYCSYATYSYLKIPFYISYDLFNVNDLLFSVSIKSEFLIETLKTLDYGDTSGDSYIINDKRERNIYFSNGIELIADYNISFMTTGPLKSNNLVDNFHFFIKPRLSYQYNKFLPSNSNLYFGFSFGIKLPLN
jgi:hypothetical protein